MSTWTRKKEFKSFQRRFSLKGKIKKFGESDLPNHFQPLTLQNIQFFQSTCNFLLLNQSTLALI